MTYSIVARCPDSGSLGVAVVTANLAVGAKVPWARAGVGVIATQADTNLSYGPTGLELLHGGASAQQVVSQMIEADAAREVRQLAVLGVNGDVAVHTGSLCIRHASHLASDGVSFQANLMKDPGVPEAMADSWASTDRRPLGERLVAALLAAQAHGGDLRGMQSAAIKIVASMPGESWEGVTLDLRVDDHLDPVTELERLLRVATSHELAGSAIQLQADGDLDASVERWRRAAELLPDSADVAFWRAVHMARAGRNTEASESLVLSIMRKPDLLVLWNRLPEAAILDHETCHRVEELIKEKSPAGE